MGLFRRRRPAPTPATPDAAPTSAASAATDDIAILVDGDQLPPELLTGLMDRLAAKWTVAERIIVRNWRSSKDQQAWRQFAAEHAFSLVQRDPVAAGKNASDIELAVNAMDLLHERGFRAYCIVTGDTDFTPLAARLQRAGCHVELVAPAELAPAKRNGRGRGGRGSKTGVTAKPASTPATLKRQSATKPAAPATSRGRDAPQRKTPKQAEPAKVKKAVAAARSGAVAQNRNAYARHVRRAIDQLNKAGHHHRGWVSVNRVGGILRDADVSRDGLDLAKTWPLYRVLEELGFAVEQTETGAYEVKM